VADDEAQALGELVARRWQVIEMIVAEKNRRRLAGQPRVLKAIDRHVGVLHAELSELDRDIDGAIRKSPAWQADADLLASVPGVGKATLRTLNMAALVASRANPVIAAHYQKLKANGKAAKQALTACIRKLLVILNAILRDRKPWSLPA
jgi:transposase